MKWRTIVELYCGTIGKCLLVISLATPFAFMMEIGVNISRYYFSLSGALVLALAYILSVLNSPSVIKANANANDYADKLLSIHKDNGLDCILEFKCLETNVNKLSEGFDRDLYYISKFASITKFVEDFGRETAIRNMAIIKYEFINSNNWLARCFLSLSFCAGILLLYFPLLKSICKIITGGLK